MSCVRAHVLESEASDGLWGLFWGALLAKNRHTGAKQHPSYSTWNSMRSRCYSPGNAGYKRYGGRGITMCERWKNDFWAFVEDMGIRPSKTHTIERKDNAKGYDPNNCVWATRAEQAINRLTTVPVGPFRSAKEAGAHAKMHPSTILYRIRKMGMDEATALSRPSRKWRHRQKKAGQRG